MKTLTLITEGNEINHHYEMKSVAIVPAFRGISDDYKFMIMIEKDEADDFLMDFIEGKTGYRIQIDTDSVRIEVKRRCFATSSVCNEEGVFVFIISSEKLVS